MVALTAAGSILNRCQYLELPVTAFINNLPNTIDSVFDWTRVYWQINKFVTLGPGSSKIHPFTYFVIWKEHMIETVAENHGL